jgi:hydrogenase maturation protein HypF
MKKLSMHNFRQFKTERRFNKPIIGLGAQAKSCLALGVGRRVFMSKPAGDLSQLAQLQHFENIFRTFSRFAKVQNFAFDLHPGYSSTQFIQEYAQGAGNHCRFFAIQHHHAHIASCMLENNLKSRVIGISFDGTGFGSDSKLWGGDFFIADFHRAQRLAHLRYIALPGSEEAILEPWRIACSWLFELYKDNFLKLPIDFLKALDKKKWALLKKMLANNINAPLTCSIGRLFDAVAALLGLVSSKINYEAEGPIKLEKLAWGFKASSGPNMYYNYKIDSRVCPFVIEPGLIIRGIVADLKREVAKNKIAFKFHNSLALIILDVARRIRAKAGINLVVLSGGVFANSLLSELVKDLLERNGFRVFQHRFFLAGDASIALGQIAIADKLAIKK